MTPNHTTARRMNLLVEMAAENRGLLTRGQLLEAGLSRHFIDRRVKSGLLRPAHAGVYQFGPVTALRVRERAALLACQGGVISHRSAAALWQILPEQKQTDPVDVVLCALPHRGLRPGIRVHRAILARDEITTVDDVHVTTAARTLLDLSRTNAQDLERALGNAERVQPDLRERIAVLLTRYPNRRGTAPLRLLIDDPCSGTFTRSEAEAKLLELVRAAGLPKPELNVMVQGFEVDCLWRAAKLVVEVDGYTTARVARLCATGGATVP